jgi:hypothetical protein
MGGDQLVPAVAGDKFEEQHGDDVRTAWGKEFAPLLAEIRAFDGVPDLLAKLCGRGMMRELSREGRPRWSALKAAVGVGDPDLHNRAADHACRAPTGRTTISAPLTKMSVRFLCCNVGSTQRSDVQKRESRVAV